MSGVKITIQKVEHASSYRVYRVVGGEAIIIGTTDADGIFYDENPIGGREMSYYAVAEASDSNYQKSDDGTRSMITLSAATKKVTAKQAKGKLQVNVEWKKVKNAKKYNVYRSEKKTGGFVKIATVKGEKKVTYLDKKVKKGKTYYYKLVAETKSDYTAPKVSKAIKVKK